MDKVFVVLENNIYGIHAEGTNVFTEDNKIINKLKPEISFSTVEENVIPRRTRKLLNDILKRKKQRIKKMEQQKAINNSIDELEKKIKELKSKHSKLERERDNIQSEINSLVRSYKEEKAIKEIMKTIKGDEIEEMSFYHGTLDVIRAKAIILKSNRKISYTYGFAYRNPTTFHQPKTVEEALKIIDKEGFLNISFGKYEIHLNAFSCNDMW